MRSNRMMGAKGKVSEDDGTFDRNFWRTATPEEHVQAIFELRTLYQEVMHGGIGPKRLDRTVGGIRRRGEDRQSEEAVIAKMKP